MIISSFCEYVLEIFLFKMLTSASVFFNNNRIRKKEKGKKNTFKVLFFLSARAKNNDSMGSRKASGRESKSCLSRIFDLRLGLFVLTSP
jgi:hypothetical protein